MKSIFIIIIVMLSVFLYSNTLTVKQDGTGDYTVIQTAIDNANNADTIRVYPGRYYENLIVEKDLSIVSNYEYTQNENDISNTILDGNQADCVIALLGTNENQINNYICGFTITNGIGYVRNPYEPHERFGGGIYLIHLSLVLKKCIVKDNKSYSGGGLYLYREVHLNLIGNIIKNNRAISVGGGIATLIYSDVIYNTEYLNNIYLNYAGGGNDIYISHWSSFQNIIVDTFTVIDPNEGYYYIYPASDGAGTPEPNLFDVDIQHGKIEQVESDLYVSTEGNNNNSGLTEDEPLQTIAFAFAKIKSDSLNYKTIHVADGVYSSSLTGEYLPLHPKSYISIVGESKENTILDAEFYGGHVRAFDPQKNYSIKNFTLLNSSFKDCITITQNTDVTIKNILITKDQENEQMEGCLGIRVSLTSFSLDNLTVKDSDYNSVYIYAGAWEGESVINISNCLFDNNATESGCYAITIGRCVSVTDSLVVNVVNTQITNNLDQSSADWLPTSSAIMVMEYCKINLINSTISANETVQSQGAALVLKDVSTVNIVNSILYGNSPKEIFLDGRYGPINLSVKNSLIDGGIWDIGQYGANDIYWDDATILDQNPQFIGDGDYPFQLSEFSPCIDAGTLDLPAGIELPETDLAGNPRIVNGMVDMGAYEYQGNGSHQDEIPTPMINSLNVYPNPFMINSPRKTELKFDLKLVESGNIKLEVYNVKGQKVYTLMDAFASQGNYLSKWDGKNSQNKFISTGTYFAKFTLNDKVKHVRKFIVVK